MRRRSKRASGAADAPSQGPGAPGFRRPTPETIRRAALHAVHLRRSAFPSQASLRIAVLREIRRDEPRAGLGGLRLRRLLIGTPGIGVRVRYAERPSVGPLTACPVCGSPLREIPNRTLAGERIVLGQRCTRCDYWTHQKHRVPVRYTFLPTGIDGRPH